MDNHSEQLLAHLLRSRRVAALGTLRDSAPFVSLVVFAVSADFSAFYLHLSRLAVHTRDILQDPRVSLMLAEEDADFDRDPQTLARVSLQGVAEELPRGHEDYAAVQALYLARFPDAAVNFRLADFSLFRIRPNRARYVAGFGKIFNLQPHHFTDAAQANPPNI